MEHRQHHPLSVPRRPGRSRHQDIRRNRPRSEYHQRALISLPILRNILLALLPILQPVLPATAAKHGGRPVLPTAPRKSSASDLTRVLARLDSQPHAAFQLARLPASTLQRRRNTR